MRYQAPAPAIADDITPAPNTLAAPAAPIASAVPAVPAVPAAPAISAATAIVSYLNVTINIVPKYYLDG